MLWPICGKFCHRRIRDIPARECPDFRFPSDQVALVAALRTPAYGCSDVDLLAWVEAGGALNYERRPPHGESPVRAAFENLAAFHKARMDRSAAATIEAFVHDRSLAIHSLGQPRPREAWRRLRYVVAQARRWAEAGDPTLRGMLDWLERVQRNTFYDTESAVPEADEDAVRLLTVHGAKGLESPVVLLSGLGAGGRAGDSVQVVPDYLGGRLSVRCGKFQTADWDGDREKELTEAEGLRLLYVAATRARERLVISLFRNANAHCPATRIAELLQLPEAAGCRSLQLVGQTPPTEPFGIRGAAPSMVDHLRAEREWSARREEQLMRFSGQHVATPSGMHEDDLSDGLDGDRAVSPRRSGSQLGLAVHAVLQQVDLGTLANLDQLARQAAAEYAVDLDVVATYARRAATSEPVRKAVASGRFWREVPMGIREGQTLIEGTIDLLWQHANTLGVVDYKTDRVSHSRLAARAGRYALQGGAYALAVQRATTRPVSTVEFVFASLAEGGVIRYEAEQVVDLMDRAASAARSAELSDALTTEAI